jgi:hypothetical protein
VQGVGDIFVPGGLPEVTYIQRDRLRLERAVTEYLEEGLKILSLSGPTKSGKTVLIRRVVPDALRISGGDVLKTRDFWDAIVDHLGAYPQSSKNITQQDSTKDSIGGKARRQFRSRTGGRRRSAWT